MDPILQSIQDSGVAATIRGSVVLFPLIEAVHVIFLALVFGTIMIVDLRLLGLASRERSFTRLSRELLRLTWLGFAGAVITGALMFSADPISYAANTAFLIKLFLLVLAGANMAVFHVLALRTVGDWDALHPTPGRARLAGAISLVLWIGIVFAGRAIGFTISGSSAEREPAAEEQMNFDEFLSGAPAASLPPPE